MKRNILVSLMIIGAVAALISGATFSAFNDSVTSAPTTLTTGTVTLNTIADGDSLTWSAEPDPGCSTGAPLNSDFSCTSQVSVAYTGNLAALLDFQLNLTETQAPGALDVDCFSVAMSTDTWPETTSGDFGAGTLVIPPTGGLPVSDGSSGTLTISVTLNGELEDQNPCQGAQLVLDLTITATEDLG